MRVLLAEDDAITRMDIKQMLRDIGVKDVGECNRGDHAVKMAMEKRWDLIIMDINMPVMDGLTAAGLISKKMRAPVILLTAHSDEDTVTEAEKSGALAFLVKPVEPNRLMAAAKVAMARFEEFKKIRSDVILLRNKKTDIEIVDRAKSYMQQQWGIPEEEAYSFIRGQSMKKQQKMSTIAEEVISGRLKPVVKEIE